MNIKNVFAIFLLLVSLGLIGYTMYSNQTKKNKYIGYIDRKDQNISEAVIKNNLQVGDYRDKYDGVLLFVVNNRFCATCINEIIEYRNVTTKYLKSSLNEYNIVRLALIIGKDKADYNRVKALLEFPFHSKLVKENSKLVSLLDQWKRNITGINQLILIDPMESKIKGRIGIFSNSIPLYTKKNLVQEVLFELEH